VTTRLAAAANFASFLMMLLLINEVDRIAIDPIPSLRSAARFGCTGIKINRADIRGTTSAAQVFMENLHL
jgi:hypothetical protein